MALKHLPIDDILPQIVKEIEASQNLILQAPPGAGKTTRLPPALLRSRKMKLRKILMLEPRRVAVRSVARRIAQEQGSVLGHQIGYQIRFEKKARKDTELLIVTEGVLLRKLQEDPFLEDIDLLIFDEFHERRIDSDLCLAFARQLQRELRPDLKIIVMSATIDPKPLQEYLSPCKVFVSEGRQHPIEYSYKRLGHIRDLAESVRDRVTEVIVEKEGDILVFLPGLGEIKRCEKALTQLAEKKNLLLLSLYGDLSAAKQDIALTPSKQRKIILSTNIAETSLTIEGVSIVIDSGLARVLRYDSKVGLNRLVLEMISEFSATQRAGRAGRQGAGFCLRLWDQTTQKGLDKQLTPEIHRIDLSSALLQLYGWGESDPSCFDWFEAPHPKNLQRANGLLQKLNAIGTNGLTPLGKQMLQLPLAPRLSRMLIEGYNSGITRKSAQLAALFSERDPFIRQRVQQQAFYQKEEQSILEKLDKIESFAQNPTHQQAQQKGLQFQAVQNTLKVSNQLEKNLRRLSEGKPKLSGSGKQRMDQQQAIIRSLLSGFPDRVARRRASSPTRGVMVGKQGVRLRNASANFQSEIFLCLSLDAGEHRKQADAIVHSHLLIEMQDLPQVTQGRIQRFDPQKQIVNEYQVSQYYDIILNEKITKLLDFEQAAEHLQEAAKTQIEKALPLRSEDLQVFLGRLQFLSHWMPELSLPTFTEDDLIELLPEFCVGKRSFSELQKLPLLKILESKLSYRQQQLLRKEAPERIQVPSGSQIKLQYQGKEAPVLAVRIQEVFGLQKTPMLANGRVPILMHLLAPNMRPQQVTQDLHNFWKETYHEVRKELRQRYPKHSWPEDPLTALAQKRPPRRKRK